MKFPGQSPKRTRLTGTRLSPWQALRIFPASSHTGFPAHRLPDGTAKARSRHLARCVGHFAVLGFREGLHADANPDTYLNFRNVRSPSRAEGVL